MYNRKKKKRKMNIFCGTSSMDNQINLFFNQDKKPILSLVETGGHEDMRLDDMRCDEMKSHN